MDTWIKSANILLSTMTKADIALLYSNSELDQLFCYRMEIFLNQYTILNESLKKFNVTNTAVLTRFFECKTTCEKINECLIEERKMYTPCAMLTRLMMDEMSEVAL